MNIEERVEQLLGQMTLKEKVSLLSGRDLWCTVPIERLGIPSINMTDGPHGVRADPPSVGDRPVGPATSYPTGVSMASTWNIELIERVGKALGEETKAMGCDILLGPCVNIARTPLAGRNFEAYTEDPYLAGRIGVAWVKGLQSQNVGASLKHFALNNQEFERDRGNSVVDERTLREIYLPQFEAIVKEAQPWTVMCSYNRVNGIYASENFYLLTDILRNEWGFEGAVISDWSANHSTVESVEAGLDLEMPGPAKWYGDLLQDAVERWTVETETIDAAVRRILRLIVLSGKMDKAGKTVRGSVDTREHRRLAQEVAEESIVLLKNNGGLLPLSKELDSIAVIGPNAAEARYGGGGSSFVVPYHTTSPLEGVRANVGSKVKVGYELGCSNLVEPQAFDSRNLFHPDGKTPGLKAEYYHNHEFKGEPVVTVEPKLDMIWFNTDPAPGIDIKDFSVRWTGKLVAPATGTYSLVLANMGEAKLYLDGKLVIENNRTSLPIQQIFADPTQIASMATVELEEGKLYDIRLEFAKQSIDIYGACIVRYLVIANPDETIPRAVELAKHSDVAVIFAGMPVGFESEGHDRPHMDLPGQQTELIRAVAAVNRKTVVVLNTGSPVSMPWLDEVPAVVEAYYPGQEGGAALANILFGDICPSGKLTVTFPKRYEENPTYINYPGWKEVNYGEGIFVGYRYYEKKKLEPLFPFGYGLSYTTFEYNDLRLPDTVKHGEKVRVTFKVKNTGKVKGKEVVQVYVHDPMSSLARPPKELKAFAKLEIEPGETRHVSFELDARALAFYEPYQKLWVAEPGEFEILVGASSQEIRLKGSFTFR